MRKCKWLLGLAGALLFLGAPAQADDSFYSNNDLVIVVGFSPGGGYDTYARTLAKSLGNHIGGKPDVIVQNMPGASGLKAVRYLDTTAPTDGTIIVAFNPGLITQAQLTPEKVNMDFRKVAWVGSISRDLRVCYTWHTTGVEKWADMLKKQKLNFGVTAPGSSSYINQGILKQVFGVKLHQVSGYPGSAEQRLAIERGELDGDCGSWTSIPDDWIAQNKINPIIRFSPKVALGLPEQVPFALDLAKSDQEKKIIRYLIAPAEIGRPYIASRSVPDERLRILRAAFDATMKDKSFLTDAKRQRLLITPMTSQEIEAEIADIYRASPGVVKAAGQIAGS